MKEKKEDNNTNEILKSLTKLAEEQRELMSKLALGGATKEIDKISKQLQATLITPSIKNAFKIADLYSSTLKDFEKSFASQNISSVQKLFDSTFPSHLKKDYELVFKTANQFKKTGSSKDLAPLIQEQIKTSSKTILLACFFQLSAILSVNNP